MTRLKTILVLLASCGMLLSGPVAAAQSGPAGPSAGRRPSAELSPSPFSRRAESFHSSIRDVALSEQGVLRARIMSRDGNAVANQNVTLSRAGQPIATSNTDENGQLRISGLTGGPYEMHIAEEVWVLRVWTASAAPPIASQSVLIVPTSRIERAQQPLSNFFAGEPIMIGALIAAAIAIPLAVHESGS